MSRVAPAPGRLWREIRPPSASILSFSPSQARPVTEVRAAPPVVANPDLQDTRRRRTRRSASPPAQCGLLLGEPAQLATGLRAGERGRGGRASRLARVIL